MKWTCVLLLILNLGFYGWSMHLSLRQAMQAPPEPLPTDVPSLTLLRELAEMPRNRDHGTDVSPTEAVATGGGSGREDSPIDESISISNPNPMLPSANVCVTAGPLMDEAQRTQLREWLAMRSVRVVDEIRAVRTRQRYGVFLEAVDGADADRQVTELKLKGITDVQVIRREQMKNAISVGVFATQEALNARLGDMQRQGYRPVVVPQYETRREFWLRAELGAGFEETTEIPAELGVSLALTRSRCTGFR